MRIAIPTKSWAFYGHLRDGEVDTFVTSIDRQATIPWSLLIDMRDAQNAARPTATLTNERGKTLATLAFSDTEAFFEPFSREQYRTTRTQMLSLSKGDYRIHVLMHGGNVAQRYTMAIGTQELFGLADIPFVLGAIHRIRALDY
ncbi:MAG: hypothetical protein M3N19_04045 [Candidatus Eremiobacteraeota bacterium]|nr:hypothetical protein [Candidatus Eremiobacteraeota bacterium]